jgi:hypothetical protein
MNDPHKNARMTPLGRAELVRRIREEGKRDPKVLAILARLEAQFATEYQIKRGRAPHCAPSMGRCRGDSHYSGECARALQLRGNYPNNSIKAAERKRRRRI